MRTRWLVLAGGVLVQLVLGGVYAWSVFSKALQDDAALGLDRVAAAAPFESAIGMIVVGAAIGGWLQDRFSPRLVAALGTGTYGAGLMVASLATTAADLWILVLGYGIIGGCGLGAAYIVPVALLQKWFPEKTALVTGLAVGGFGFGATLTSPLAQWLIARDPSQPTSAFLWLGLLCLITGLAGSSLLRRAPSTAVNAAEGEGLTPAQALRTPQWYLLTGILMLAVMSGISLISMMAGAAVDVGGLGSTGAVAAVGVLALFNGAGRVAWAALAQRIGQVRVLAAILVLEGVSLILLPHTCGALFLILSAVVYLCYGGAFGTLPSTAGAFFGLRHAGAIYGLMLAGWSVGGLVGPLLASALVGARGSYAVAFSVMGAAAAAGAAIPLLLRPPKPVAD